MWIWCGHDERLTGKFPEVIDLEHVVAVRRHDTELLLELPVQRVAPVHHGDHKRLDAAPPGVRRRALQTVRVSLVGLPARDDDGHFPHTRPRPLEHPVSPPHGAARERALAHEGHGAHRRLDRVARGSRPEGDHHRADAAVEHHAHARGVPVDRGPVDQRVDEVLDPLEVVRADALGAVNHKNQLQGGSAASRCTSWRHPETGYRQRSEDITVTLFWLLTAYGSH